ncbi:MAG: ABC transporter ATP-binding protein [Bacilli bacterium]|nr:ABC transporter ATP-binding protein [Bacilli bacterium]
MNKAFLKRYVFIYKKDIALICLFVVLFLISQLSQPFIIGNMLDHALMNDKQTFVIEMVVLATLSLVGVFSNFAFEYLSGVITQKVIYQVREDIFRKYNSISIEKMNQYSLGDLLQLEINDMENVSNGIFALFKSFLEGIIAILVTIIIMLYINWLLALGVILLTPLSVIMSRFVGKFSHTYFKKQSKLQAELNSISVEAISNGDILSSFNYEEESIKKYIAKDEELSKEAKIAQFSASWINPSTRLVNNTIYAIIGIAGIIMISYSSNNVLISLLAIMSVGKLSSFLSYTSQYSKPFNDISSIIGEYEAMKASIDRMMKFLNEEDDVDEGDKTLNNLSSIIFDNVSFSYDKNKTLIEGFNTNISSGMKVAIVGPTGAGKTTLINLLMRFYDPDSGIIKYNDINGKEIKKSSLRSNFGMVLQETWIFKGTILENVRYAKRNATNQKVIEACQRAHLDEFVSSLPQGYETVISSNDGLSEGQRQMISIARVMLANPSIILLDEATSNVDTRTEKLIINSFDNMTKGKTSIVIAHRLSTIVNADMILVLKDGNVIEQGNHEQLLKKKGFYYSMYISQFK